MYVVNLKGEHEQVQPYNWEVDVFQLPLKGGWKANREKYGKREHWYSDPMFIDTETSHLGEEHGWIHQWAIYWSGCYIIGRTAEQLTDFLARVSEWAVWRGKGNKKWKVLGYIHNMGYDMEYLREYFPDHEPEFFAVKPHRILTAKWGSIELRCSYLLTQKPLAKWAKDSKSNHPKLSGTYDYDVVRTPADHITEQEWAYQLNDVIAMADSWNNDREHDGYTVLNVPLTSTGFVRTDCREASQTDPYWKLKLNDMQPNIGVYDALEQAFQGGETHGNRFYKEVTVRQPIGHRDFVSSYPARQMLNSFPMGQFVDANITKIDEVYRLLPTTACLIHIALNNPELKTRAITAPYLSWAKCQRMGSVQELLDNGRVIKIWGAVHFWCTEFDLVLIDKQYKFEYSIIQSYTAPKGKLPKWLRGKVMEYYNAKTTLKHIDPSNYMRGKAKLNGIYGMTAQKNIRDELIYEDGEWSVKPLELGERETALDKYIKKKSTFIPFAFGVWTTALARFALNECIELVGYDKFLYCDTDSIFYLMDDETEQKFERYNQKIRDKAELAGAYVDYQGVRNTLGEFTMEDDAPIREFRQCHSKCYALVDRDGKLSVTVAGVTKHQRSNPKLTNADELGSIDNLQTGFIFRECGGTRIVYNNDPLHIIEVNGVEICCGSSAIIMPTEYQVNDLDNMDEDDLLMAETIIGTMTSDIYGDWSGLK